MVSYIGRFAPAVAVPLASSKGGEPATELTSTRSNTTSGDATSETGSIRIHRSALEAHHDTGLTRAGSGFIGSLTEAQPVDPEEKGEG